MPEPDGPQFQNLWDSAMAGAQANLDAISDEELDEAEAEAMISDSISDMISASQIEETGHTQDAPPRVDSAGRPHLTPEEHERWFRIHTLFDEDEGPQESDDMNRRGPDYSQPDPFDRSDPEQARQAEAIEAMNKLWEE